MLIENLYKISSLKIEDTVVNASIKVNNDHAIFNGHFPGNPVMPGVCMIQIIKELAEQALNVELFMQKASNIKFMALINPNENPNLDLILNINKEEGVVKVKNITKFKDIEALKFSGTFRIV